MVIFHSYVKLPEGKPGLGLHHKLQHPLEKARGGKEIYVILGRLGGIGEMLNIGEMGLKPQAKKQKTEMG